MRVWVRQKAMRLHIHSEARVKILEVKFGIKESTRRVKCARIIKSKAFVIRNEKYRLVIT